MRPLLNKGESRADAEDLVHDSLERMLASHLRIQNRLAYGLVVSRNRRCAELKRRKVRLIAEATLWVLRRGLEVPDTFRVIAGIEDVERLATCLNEMPKWQRAACIASRIEGLTVRQIAYGSGVTRETLKSVLRRADRDLADAFGAKPPRRLRGTPGPNSEAAVALRSFEFGTILAHLGPFS